MAWEYRAAHPWPAPEQVTLTWVDDWWGIAYEITCNQRDVEYAQRYGWPSSILAAT